MCEEIKLAVILNFKWGFKNMIYKKKNVGRNHLKVKS